MDAVLQGCFGRVAARLLAGVALVLLGILAQLDPSHSAAAAGGPRCEGKPATIVGTPGDDHLTGTPGRDVIVGLKGDDRVVGRGGRDLVCAGPGKDKVRARDGTSETVRCGPGDDVAVTDRGDRPPGCELAYQFIHVHLDATSIANHCSNLYATSPGDSANPSPRPVSDGAPYVGWCAGPLLSDGAPPYKDGTGRINWTAYRSGAVDLTIRRMDNPYGHETLYGFAPSRSSDALYIHGGDDWGTRTPETGRDLDKLGQRGGPLRLRVTSKGATLGYDIEVTGYVGLTDPPAQRRSRRRSRTAAYVPNWRPFNMFVNAVGADGSCHKDAGSLAEYGIGADGKDTCTGKVVSGDSFVGDTVQVVWTGWNYGRGPGVDLSLRVINGDFDHGITGWAPNRASGHFMVTGGEPIFGRVGKSGTNLGIEPPGALNDSGGCSVGRLGNQGTESLNVTYQKGGLFSDGGYSFDIRGYICI
jgi:hypothetical protein